ncbi:MAG: VOC family protein [Gammaproteobacteria bacterium]|nr:VOC family protein [Gammaproteobacteria bacterium]
MTHPPLIDHIGIPVSSFSSSLRFYTSVLRSLGYHLVTQSEVRAGFGLGRKPEFSIFELLAAKNQPIPQHIAFSAVSRDAVDAFYVAALSAGGVPNGLPGLRPEYHPNYYGAFVIDPDGNNIEAVCHTRLES